MSIIIQLHMNRLNLPREMLDTIKAYLFYDTKTYHIIQNAKKQKQITNNLINSAMSRANRFKNDPYYTDDEEVWAFGFSADHLTEDMQLQSVNCYYCGNYIQHTHYYEMNYPKRIYCICSPEHEAQYYDFTEDDLYSHDNSDDEIDELDWYYEDYDY